jgi:ATP-binding cassette subfamily B protein
MKKAKSVWSKAIPFKEQVHIFKRVLKYVKPFKVEMGIAFLELS